MLFGLFRRAASGRGAAGRDPALPPAVRTAVLAAVGGAAAVPVLRSSARRAFTVTTDPSSDLDALVAVVEADEGLTGRAIKLANSVYFERGVPSHTVRQAAVVIGETELRALVQATTFRDLFPSRSPQRGVLWTHNLAVAAAARSLASLVSRDQGGGDGPATAFVAGFLHDVGKLFLLQKLGARYESLLRGAAARGISDADAEAEAFPFDHTEAGLLVAEAWSFPGDLRRAIRAHHAPWKELETEPPVVSVVKLADLLVRAAVPASGGPRAAALSEAWGHFGIDGKTAASVVTAAAAAVTEASDAHGGE